MNHLTDFAGQTFRLTDERLDHRERRPEMVDQLPRIEETLGDPDEVRTSDHDDEVRLYYRRCPETPVTEKYLLAVVRVGDDSFVITAFFTDRVKSGEPIEGGP